VALFHRDWRAARTEAIGVKPPKFGVLYGLGARGGKHNDRAEISDAQQRANVLILLDCDSPAWTADQCWTSVPS